MSWTVQQVITEVQKRFPDANTTSCTLWVNLIHRELLSRIPQLRMDSVTQNLTAGTGEYQIGEVIFQVREVEYVTAANTSTRLEYMTVEQLDATQPGWRAMAPGTPSVFYLSDNQASGNSEVIGLFPPPNQSTATYPYLQMQVSELENADLTTGNSIPPTVPNASVYVEGASKLAAISLRPTMAMTFNSTYETAVNAVQKYVESRAVGWQKPTPAVNPRRATQ